MSEASKLADTQKLVCRRMPNFKLFHQLADSFAAGADDAGVGPWVQVNVLAHHLLQLGHQLLNGLTCLLHVSLIARDHDQVLRVVSNAYKTFMGRPNAVLQKCDETTHLVLVPFVRELDAHIVIFPDLRNDGSLASDDFGVEFWVH